MWSGHLPLSESLEEASVLEIKRLFTSAGRAWFSGLGRFVKIAPRLSDSSLNPLKKDGLSVRNIGKPHVAFLLAILLFMSIFLSWINSRIWLSSFYIKRLSENLGHVAKPDESHLRKERQLGSWNQLLMT